MSCEVSGGWLMSMVYARLKTGRKRGIGGSRNLRHHLTCHWNSQVYIEGGRSQQVGDDRFDEWTQSFHARNQPALFAAATYPPAGLSRPPFPVPLPAATHEPRPPLPYLGRFPHPRPW